ncbi:MAG TPA: TonB-dependent receptor [Candidatus Aminicenantes bacterium]|nr:TonB-dependent receptor [Candidatus Aminicenantes bacterium]
MRKHLIVLALALGLVLLNGAALLAQSVMEGKITGTVTDENGEPLPGVSVEITGATIMGKRAAVTSARGTFVFLNVPPGKIAMAVSLAGFKTWVQDNLALGAGSALEVNPVLVAGAIEEQITVLAASPIVDVKTSAVDSRLESEMLAKLPTTRDAFYDLALTTPGMFDVGSSGGWLPSPTAYGGSSMENVFLVNGVNTTNPRGAAFGSLVRVNYNAVEEVRVVALGSKAEYGSFSGAAIDVLTKSGSNKLHGNVAYYTELRGGFFQENYPITSPGDPNHYLKAPDDWLFYYGGDRLAGETKKNWEGNFTIGGPIVKDKIWFYGALDYIRSASLPVNWGLINESWGRYADLKVSAEPLRNTRAWVSYHFENNKGTGWSWGSQPEWDTSMTYGAGSKNNTLSAQFQWLPSSTAIFTAKYLGFWTNDRPVVPADAPDHPGYINWWKWGKGYGVNGAFPFIEAQKSTRQTIQADVSTYVEDFLGEHDIKFGVQYTKGRGNWMGGYFQNYANFTYPLGGWWGYYSGLGYSVDALKSQWYYYGTIGFDDGLLFYNNKTIDNPFLTVRTADSLGLFVDDQWSPTKRLTFNLGLRFDRMTTKYGEGKVFDFLRTPSDINDPNLGVLRTRAGSGNIFDFKTLSPRLGATYQLTKDGKTVLRANYGRYYMPLAVEFMRRFGPDMQTTNLDYEIYWVPWDIADADGNGYIDCMGVSGVNELREAVRHIHGQTPIYVEHRTTDRSWTLNVAEGVKDMFTDQISLNIERELVKDFSLGATYIYKHSANLFVNVPINEVTGREWAYDRVRFDPEFGDPVDLYSVKWEDYNGDGVIDGADIAWIGTHGDYRVENQQAYNYIDGETPIKPQRTYQALQFVLNKRYSNRWQGLASLVYSWSNGTAQRTMRQDDNMMGPMITDDTWMGTLNYTVNNMNGVLPFVPKWEIKASGSYTVPGVEMDLGLRFRFHTGRPLWRLEPYDVATQWGQPPGSVISSGGTGRIVSSTTPIYLPSLAIFDLRAEKAIQVRGLGSLHIIADVFNLFNSANVTNAEYSGLWGRITGISDARRFRLSFMYQF